MSPDSCLSERPKGKVTVGRGAQEADSTRSRAESTGGCAKLKTVTEQCT